MPQYMHRGSQQRLGDYWFQAFKKISVHSSADHYASKAETLVTSHNKEYKLYRISSVKSQRVIKKKKKGTDSNKP